MFKLIKSTLLVLSGVLAMSSCSKENVVEAPTKMSVTFGAGENGTVEPSGKQSGDAGSTISSVAKATAADYALDGWYVDDKKIEPSEDYILAGDTLNVKLTQATKDKTYTAKFKLATYEVTFASEDKDMGTVDPDGKKSGSAGDAISSVATATAANYVLDGWYVDDKKIEPSEDFIFSGNTLNVKLTQATKDKTYTAKFKLAAYKVIFASGDNGTVFPDGEKGGSAGETISSVAIAKTNYALEGWYVDDKKIEPSEDYILAGDTLNVKLTEATKNKTYTAKFQLETYEVTFASENKDMGTVDPDGKKSGDAGSTIFSVAKATAANYVLDGWYVDDKKIEPSEDYILAGDTLNVKLTEATKNKTYTAKF
ncbi:MAG: InlB B-repeat-containing protein, partial [Phocaeicola sp.]